MSILKFPAQMRLITAAIIADQVGMSIGQDGRGNLTIEQKRNKAIAYLKERNIYATEKGNRFRYKRANQPEDTAAVPKKFKCDRNIVRFLCKDNAK